MTLWDSTWQRPRAYRDRFFRYTRGFEGLCQFVDVLKKDGFTRMEYLAFKEVD